jgi:hypothetical protein
MNLNRESESDPRLNKSDHLNWEMIVIWSFVALSFAAFALSSYIIWTKCLGNSPS